VAVVSIFNDLFFGGRPRFLFDGVSEEVDTMISSDDMGVGWFAMCLVDDDDDFVTTDVVIWAAVEVAVVVDGLPPFVIDLVDGSSYDFLLLVDGGLPGPRFKGVSSKETDDHDDLLFVGLAGGGGDGSEACCCSSSSSSSTS
jgi:hypothetical protein